MLSSPVPSEWVSGAYGDRDRSNGVGVTKIPRVPRDGGFGALKPPNPIPGSAPAAAPRPRAPPAPGWIRRCSPTRCTTLQKIQKGSGWRRRHHPKKKQNAPKNPKSPPFTFMVGLSPPRRRLVLQQGDGREVFGGAGAVIGQLGLAGRARFGLHRAPGGPAGSPLRRLRPPCGFGAARCLPAPRLLLLRGRLRRCGDGGYWGHCGPIRRGSPNHPKIGLGRDPSTPSRG